MFFSSWQFNHWNEEFSISHKIFSVGAFEPDFVIPLENVTVAQGRDATFTCVVNNLGGHRVSGDGASTPAKVCIGFQSQMRFDLQHTQAERESQLPAHLSVIDYSLFVSFSIRFQLFFFVSFSSVSHVHKCTTILSIFEFAEIEIKNCTINKQSYRKLFTIHSSQLLCNPKAHLS